MNESVRLVIWDLDETFWKGTLTEGGIQEYVQANHHIIIELARRGIISSICSKNDREQAKTILEEKGIWEYFVFPSIDWAPKGTRITQIIDNMQLRCESVLFVDDNHGNREEARLANPGIQVIDETFTAGMLKDPRFSGKPDLAFKRLSQYKLLEQKAAERVKIGTSSNLEFLRNSKIIIRLTDHVEEEYIDRAIELINRTNQLNFTKERLSDDISLAREQLKHQLSIFGVRAGIVHVADKYGDYGCVGFFLVQGFWGNKRLRHFLFSCRTLGMGVEQYVYNILGRPALQPIGGVISSVEGPIPDWVNVFNENTAEVHLASNRPPLVLIRGGCENEIIEHYFRLRADDIRAEFVAVKSWSLIPRHNTTLLNASLVPLTPNVKQILNQIGWSEDDLITSFFSTEISKALIVFFPSGDGMPAMRHKIEDLELPFAFSGYGSPLSDKSEEERRTFFERNNFSAESRGLFIKMEKFIRDSFVPVHPLDAAKRSYVRVASRLPAKSLVVVIKPNYERYGADGRTIRSDWQVELNADLEKSFGGRSNVRLIEMRELLDDLNLVLDDQYNHFHRSVYYRLFNVLIEVYGKWLETCSTLE